MFSKTMKINTVFAVPLVSVHYENAVRLGESLTKLFLEKERLGDQYRNSRIFDTQHGALFESRFDLFSWPEPEVAELTTFCHRAVASVVAQLNAYSQTDMENLSFDYQAWFHITRAGGFQALHNHPNASWSGIYCIDPGDEIAGRPESGAVRFRNPNQNAGMFADNGNKQLIEPFGVGGVQVRHEPGKLLLFPSYLEHEIFPYAGQRPRIVVAFNCAVKSYPQQSKQPERGQ